MFSKLKHPTNPNRFDVCIIGAGSVGVEQALKFSAKQRVAIVDDGWLGGQLTLAELVLVSLERAQSQSIESAEVMSWLRLELSNQAQRLDTKGRLQSSGVTILSGPAVFASLNAISIRNVLHESKAFVVATGVSPIIPEIDGLNSVRYYTLVNFKDLTKLPSRLVVLGSDPMGLGLATAAARLGCRVSVLMPSDQKTDALDAAKVRSSGVNIIKVDGIGSVEKLQKAVKVNYHGGLAVSAVAAEVIVLAYGWQPNLGLDLVKANVNFSEKGIPTDARGQTNVKTIFAAGAVARAEKPPPD
ncbi:MAG TPA: FAD-dependent oxidoreductase [Candidatus Saccharimonadales bacterium]|nr:FAD-dependent oxidoreductase [Candidatus Saccharimonadales bacterium]